MTNAIEEIGRIKVRIWRPDAPKRLVFEVMTKPDATMEELAERVAGTESPRSPSSPRHSISGPIGTPGSPSPINRRASSAL